MDVGPRILMTLSLSFISSLLSPVFSLSVSSFATVLELILSGFPAYLPSFPCPANRSAFTKSSVWLASWYLFRVHYQVLLTSPSCQCEFASTVCIDDSLQQPPSWQRPLIQLPLQQLKHLMPLPEGQAIRKPMDQIRH